MKMDDSAKFDLKQKHHMHYTNTECITKLEKNISLF